MWVSLGNKGFSALYSVGLQVVIASCTHDFSIVYTVHSVFRAGRMVAALGYATYSDSTGPSHWVYRRDVCMASLVLTHSPSDMQRPPWELFRQTACIYLRGQAHNGNSSLDMQRPPSPLSGCPVNCEVPVKAAIPLLEITTIDYYKSDYTPPRQMSLLSLLSLLSCRRTCSDSL